MKSKKKDSVGLEPIKAKKCLVENGGLGRAARYNYTVMDKDISVVKSGFAGSLRRLRERKGVSAREMSLSLGQGASYINDIESGRNLPSMAMFFEICEYLQSTPLEFFAYTAGLSEAANVLLTFTELLPAEDLELLSQLAQRLQKRP